MHILLILSKQRCYAQARYIMVHGGKRDSHHGAHVCVSAACNVGSQHATWERAGISPLAIPLAQTKPAFSAMHRPGSTWRIVPSTSVLAHGGAQLPSSQLHWFGLLGGRGEMRLRTGCLHIYGWVQHAT